MSGRRRSHGEGSVFRRASDGRWVGRVDVGHVEGKRKRATVYGATEREVLGKLREVVRAKERGRDFTARRRTVGEWLTEWLEEVKATDGRGPRLCGPTGCSRGSTSSRPSGLSSSTSSVRVMSGGW